MTYEQVMMAYHEAGHLAIAFAANLAVGGAVLWKTRKRWMGVTAAFEKRELPRKIKVAYHFAGMVAEQIASRLETNKGQELTIGVIADDREQRLPEQHAIKDLEQLDSLMGSDFWGTKKAQEWRSHTERFLRKHWPMVMMIAAKLLASGKIEPKELRGIMILLGMKIRPEK
ncbi:MAG: hypothetical protein ABSB63_22885 [Spirochaetia bacterium]|jgi:hypothetical protein